MKYNTRTRQHRKSKEIIHLKLHQIAHVVPDLSVPETEQRPDPSDTIQTVRRRAEHKWEAQPEISVKICKKFAEGEATERNIDVR